MEAWARTTDPSLVRHFVNSTLALAAPPYSREFASGILRITSGPDAGLRAGGAIGEFVKAVRAANKGYEPPLPKAELDGTL